jgi:hypothetical protein
MEKMLAFVGGAKVVFVIPLPRYVLSGCCKDTEHVSSRLSGELAAEFAGAEKCLLEAAAMGERTGRARLINLLSFFGSCESPPQDLTTVDGTSIWAGDGVHLTSNASRVAARKLMADLVRGGEEGEANKRTRLESVVPAPAPAKKKVAAAGAAADFAAQARPAADAAMALRPASTVPERTRIRSSKPHQEGGRIRARQCARRQPWCQPWAERAAQRRPARPLGPLVKKSENILQQ